MSPRGRSGWLRGWRAVARRSSADGVMTSGACRADNCAPPGGAATRENGVQTLFHDQTVTWLHFIARYSPVAAVRRWRGRAGPLASGPAAVKVRRRDGSLSNPQVCRSRGTARRWGHGRSPAGCVLPSAGAMLRVHGHARGSIPPMAGCVQTCMPRKHPKTARNRPSMTHCSRRPLSCMRFLAPGRLMEDIRRDAGLMPINRGSETAWCAADTAACHGLKP